MKNQNIIAVCLLLSTFGAQAQTISTIAGNGTAGYGGDGSSAISAQLNMPSGIAVDGSGNVYIADKMNNRIRKVSTSGTITTIAGNGTAGFAGDGMAATSAELNSPEGVAIDASGNVYIGDRANECIRKVNASGIITTFAGTGGVSGFSGDGSLATAAKLAEPYNIAVDASGNVYIGDSNNGRIRKVDGSGVITTFAGNGGGLGGDGGPATAAGITVPYGVAVDGSGNVYISDVNSQNIRKVNTAGIISTYAGTGATGFSGDGGPATDAKITPSNIGVDAAGNVYIADGGGFVGSANNRIRKISTSSGIITTVVGNGTAGYSGDGSSAISAELNAPNAVAMDASGNMYIADMSNNRVRKVTSSVTVVKQTYLTNDISIFPNPNNGVFTIIGSLNATADENVSLEIIDMLGQTVYNKNVVVEKGSINSQILLPGIANGIYFLKISSETESLNYRFMIEK